MKRSKEGFKKLTDESIIPFGYYNKLGYKMANVPASYLIWVNENVKPRDNDAKAVLLYIKENWSVIKKELEDNKTSSKKDNPNSGYLLFN